ncbi:piggyBac transposable element-derived protein 3-like, partial [Anoplophora glabripennis]|uniref:piggyBac transposable element-derived protein 3-like n=1 Tax=Anoplophora glabripennis TaxID=217634 RepID=UPI000874F511
MDANSNVYRIGILGKKWWWAIFTWLIDTSIQNAWILAKSTGHKVSQLLFRREIAQCYLTKYQVTPKGAGRSSSASAKSRVHNSIQLDRMDHGRMVESVPDGKPRRCTGQAHTEKSSAVRTQCKKCN